LHENPHWEKVPNDYASLIDIGQTCRHHVKGEVNFSYIREDRGMAVNSSVHIGILSPATSNRPHFKSLDGVLPEGVSIAHEGLGLLGESYQDLVGKSDRIVELAKDFVKRHAVRGLMLTGGFVTLLNPGLESNVSDAIGLPVASAVASAVAALSVYRAHTVLLMTPFDAVSDGVIKSHLNQRGFDVELGPPFENRKAGAPVNLTADELVALVTKTFNAVPAVDAIYFQGATLDPLPVIERLESRLAVPVITSNTAMLWNLLSRLGLNYSVQGYGRLLAEWPRARSDRAG
jgi:maleate cis-trans isomerase